MRRLAVIIVSISMFSSTAHASWNSLNWLTQYQTPNMHWGQLAIHPSYAFSEMYDSNIYLVPRDQANGAILGNGHRESWITKNNIGLETDLPWHKLHDLSLGYDFESQIYSTQPDINNAIGQTAHGQYTYAGAYGLTFKAGDNYVNTTDPAFSQLTGRQWRWQNSVYSTLDYTPRNGRLAGGLDASQKNDKYIRPDFAQQLNRYEDNFGFNVGYMVRPKTKVYIAYHRDIIHYTIPELGLDKDNRSHNVGLGVIGELAPKLEGQIEGGVSDRQYDVATASGNSRVFISATVSAAVTWKADKFTTVKLDLNRSAQESIDASNPLYFQNVIALDLAHQFPRKFSAGLKASFELDQYPFAQIVDASGSISKRRDDNYQVGAWITYDIQKWLFTGVAFNHRERDSTMSGQFGFEDNQVTWQAALKF